MNIEQILKENECTIIDVRTPGEYCCGNIAGSINIPLKEIPNRIDEIKTLNTPLVLCCASGGRSGKATQMLTQENIDCYNGGSWLDVNLYQS